MRLEFSQAITQAFQATLAAPIRLFRGQQFRHHGLDRLEFQFDRVAFQIKFDRLCKRHISEKFSRIGDLCRRRFDGQAERIQQLPGAEAGRAIRAGKG